MRAADLRLTDLLAFEPDGGILSFAGSRTLLLDAVALGLLRKELIDTVGLTAARGILTRFGYAHGWRTAEALRDRIPWSSPHEWRIAGGRLHRLQGMVTFEPGAEGPDGPFACAYWRDSYEAEQHLLHLGAADAPVCWTLCGFASGYLSRANGRDILCLEESCVGRGDAVCQMVGRPADEWGADAQAELAFYQQRCLDAALDKLRQELQEAERRLRRHRREARLEEEVDDGIVARSEAMVRVLSLARRLARVDASVLLTGESGVGKERIARLIHDASPRVSGPFVALNCGAVPESLLESELFGHTKGAFTGATTDRPGLIEAAHRGTLFLDEVGEITPAMQVRLLRVLQERTVRRLGETVDRPVDVRVLSATHRDLGEALAERRMREDFYYRIRVTELRIPPLRERREDILPLARFFLAEAAAAPRPPLRLNRDAADALVRHPWPGNVRELQNAISHAVAFAEAGVVGLADLPEELTGGPRSRGVAGAREASAGGSERLEDVERRHVLAVLEASAGNRAEAARRLGIGQATLFRKLRLWGEGALSGR